MKKIHYLAICLLATGLAACTQNEEISSLENQKAITFDTYVGRDAATRASVIDVDALAVLCRTTGNGGIVNKELTATDTDIATVNSGSTVFNGRIVYFISTKH